MHQRPRAGSNSIGPHTSCPRSSSGEATTRLAPWRKRLFIPTSYITADAAEHFSLPRDRTVIMGSHIDV
jgi:K+ transporter